MAKKKKPINGKKYILTKIANCDMLIQGAPNQLLQAEYKKYKAFWESKLKKTDRPDEIAKKQAERAAKAAKERDDELAFQMAEAAAQILKEQAEKEALDTKAAIEKRKAEIKAELESLENPNGLQSVDDIDDKPEEVKGTEEFEL